MAGSSQSLCRTCKAGIIEWHAVPSVASIDIHPILLDQVLYSVQITNSCRLIDITSRSWKAFQVSDVFLRKAYVNGST